MRSRMLRWLARFAYWLGIDALFYFLNRDVKRIVTFHNVLPDELFVSGLANGVSNSASEFRAIIQELNRHFRFSTDVNDIHSVTITFDDGYANQYEVASSILLEYSIPAILFVAGDLVDASPCQALVVDQLLHWTAMAPEWAVKKAFGPFTDRHSLWVNVVRPEFCSDVDQRGRGLLSRINQIYPMQSLFDALPVEYVRLRLSGVKTGELDVLRKRGWITGWHTKSHFPLSALSRECMREEMSPGEGMLGDSSGISIGGVVFSYPYGEQNSVNEDAILIAEELGYPCALSNTTLPYACYSRYFVPRMALCADKYLLHFELSGVKHFLKYRSLLPRGGIE